MIEPKKLINKELLKGCLKTIVLKMLSSNNMHGYQIAQTLKTTSADKVEITEGSLYPLLHSLESDGFLIAHWEKPDGKRKRKVYGLTKKGHEALEEKTHNWNEFVSAMEQIMAAQVQVA